MQPYVIKQGDFLAKLAYRFGFDADTVWSDPKNAQLRQRRPNPNILCPTDLLYIPDQIGKKHVMHELVLGTTNTFVADVPTVTVTVKFTEQSLASQPYSIQELPELAGKTSGADGMVSFAAPVTLGTATIVFTDSGATFVYKMGHLDPIDTLSGVFQRLQHLGFIEASVPVMLGHGGVGSVGIAVVQGGSGPRFRAVRRVAAPQHAASFVSSSVLTAEHPSALEHRLAARRERAVAFGTARQRPRRVRERRLERRRHARRRDQAAVAVGTRLVSPFREARRPPVRAHARRTK